MLAYLRFRERSEYDFSIGGVDITRMMRQRAHLRLFGERRNDFYVVLRIDKCA